MKRLLTLFLSAALCLSALSAAAQNAQPKKVINRFGMKLIPLKDGGYALDGKTLELLGDASPDGLYEPFTRRPVISSSKVKEVESVDVVYKTYPDRELKLLIAPVVNAAGPVPVVCFIHGGGWRAGNPSSFLRQAKYMAGYCGLAGVSIQYSLADGKDVTIETSMQDLHDAVQYLRDHAAEFNLDTSRLAFAGLSAGGHLAAMMGLTEPDAKVISGWSGVYDMCPHMSYWSGGKNPDVKKYFFGGKSERKLRTYSPLYLIPSDRQIAVQLFQGTADASVHESQARDFEKALKEAGQNTVQANYYEYYSHGLCGSSDKNSECFGKFVKFVKKHIYD